MRDDVMSGGATSASLAFAPEERFLDCVHCGLCLPACPTYLETAHEADSPRGRIYLMRRLQLGALAPSTDVVRHLDLCLGCRACETACPSGVRYGELIEAARPVLNARGRRSPVQRLRRFAVGRLVARPRGQRLLRAAARLPPRLLAFVARRESIPEGLRFQAALALALPRISGREPPPALLEPAGRPRGTVALLPGCLAQTFFPGTNRRAARLLALAGFRVCTPEKRLCCGALLRHLGYHEEALRLVGETARTLTAMSPDAVAVTAAGCGAMLQSYGETLGTAVGAAVAARAQDVTALLAEGALPEPLHSVPHRLTYHDACHLAHAQGVRDAPRALLRRVPLADFVELPEADHCCGSAGTYNLTEPVMGRRLMLRKARHVLGTGASIVAAANPGCVVQIRAGLAYLGATIRVCHPVDVLAEAHFGPDAARAATGAPAL
jgi:glycolate oxidase iron-sulfur subunit